VISDDGRLLEGGSLDVDAEALLTTGKPFVTRTREAEALRCRRCGSQVAWPDQLDDAGRAAIAGAARVARLPAIKLLQEQFGMSLGGAKAVGFHISKSQNTCHRCGTAVPEGVSTCPNCQCLNLNW
jgi:ribosomal protein L37E